MSCLGEQYVDVTLDILGTRQRIVGLKIRVLRVGAEERDYRASCEMHQVLVLEGWIRHLGMWNASLLAPSSNAAVFISACTHPASP